MKLAADDAAIVAVAIEIPQGAVVEPLVGRGFDEYSLIPKQMDRFRDRHMVAGATATPAYTWPVAGPMGTLPSTRALSLADVPGNALVLYFRQRRNN